MYCRVFVNMSEKYRNLVKQDQYIYSVFLFVCDIYLILPLPFAIGLRELYFIKQSLPFYLFYTLYARVNIEFT